MSAYLVEIPPYGDSEILDDPTEIPGCEVVAELELVASYDHGLRTADETAFIVGSEAAACVMAPLLCAVWGVPLEYWRGTVDYVAALQNGAEIDYNGEGWSDLSEDGAEIGEALYDWSDQMMATAESVGWVVDSSADAGMTWFYRPMI